MHDKNAFSLATMLDVPVGLHELAAQVGAALAARGAMLATAESCTGGLIAAAVTSVAGSSAWFDRGFVTYSNDAKVELLGVPPEVLDSHGAVSPATVLAMAAGALARSRAQVAVSVSGIAGPGGATPTKPVGTVCLAWASRDGWQRASTEHFAGDRAAVRLASARTALAGVLAWCRAHPELA